MTTLEEQLTEQPNADPEYKIAKQQVNVAVAPLVMGRGAEVWPLLRHSSDPTRCSFLIERLGPGGVDANLLLSRLAEQQDVSVAGPCCWAWASSWIARRRSSGGTWCPDWRGCTGTTRMPA